MGVGLAISFSQQAQKVGIGTSAPQAMLHIELDNNATYPMFKITRVGQSVPYFIVDSNGRVGIGVLTPNEALHVSGNVQFSGALMPGGNAGLAGQVLVSQGLNNTPVWQDASALGDNWGSQTAVTQNPVVGDGTIGSPIRLQSGTSAGDILVYDGSTWVIQQAMWDTVCSGALSNYVQKWTGMLFCNSQIYDDGTNVGIGTSSPTHRLHVAGSGYVRDSFRIDGDFRPGGNPGSVGQVLTSQGPGVPPQWTSLSNSSCFQTKGWTNGYVDTLGNEVPCSSAPSMNWEKCQQACLQSTAQGFSDWRMPFAEEVIYGYITGNFVFPSCGNTIWTATPVGGSSGGNYFALTPNAGVGLNWAGILINSTLKCVCTR